MQNEQTPDTPNKSDNRLAFLPSTSADEKPSGNPKVQNDVTETADPSDSEPTPSIVQAVYRTVDGLEDYTFSFEQQGDGSWRVYIVTQPDYRGRDDSAHFTHRDWGGRGRRYVDWCEALTTLENAKQLAALWAEYTQEYIKHGT